MNNNISSVKERSDIAFLDVLSWMATIAVVLFHVITAKVNYVAITDSQLTISNVITSLLKWHVPMFVMISGSCFLNPGKVVTYSGLFKKNIKRICLALLIFGYPMALIERYLECRAIDICLFTGALI